MTAARCRRPRRAWWLLALACAVFSPHLFVPGATPTELRVGAPAVHSGDEPHHFIILSSLLLDGDFDVANNYARARAGEVDAGRRFAHARLDHHTSWYVGGRRVMWRDVYGIDDMRWTRDADDRHRPLPRRGYQHLDKPAGHAEYSQHPPGVSMLVAPLLWPLRGHWLLEPASLVLSGLCVLLTALAVRRLALLLAAGPRTADFVAVVAVLGTPAWHYGRTLFGESFLMALVTGGLAFALVGRRFSLAGVCFAFALLIKPIALLVALPLWCWLLARRDFRACARLSVPIAAGLLVYLVLNAVMFGGPFRIAQPGTEWHLDVFGHLLGRDHGLLLYAPLALPGVLGILSLCGQRPGPGFVMFGGAFLYAGFIITQLTTAGYCYGPRYFVPILPILALGLVRMGPSHPRRSVRWAVLAVCLVSIGINAMAALYSWRYWSAHPLLS